MSKRHLYLLAFSIIAIACAAIFYKWSVLKFPLQPDAQVQVWTVQAHVEYQPRAAANAVTLQIPRFTPGFAVLDERFIARGYSKLESTHAEGREVQWANRRVVGEQDLYYRATIVRSQDHDTLALDFDPVIPSPPELEEPYVTAADSLLVQVREGSINNVTYARELLRRLGEATPSEEVALLSERYGADESDRAYFAVQLLARRSIPARVIHGLRLTDEPREGEDRLQPWLMVHDGLAWTIIDPRTFAEGLPPDLFLWSSSDRRVLQMESETAQAALMFTVSRNLADAMAIAERRLEVQDANLVRYSLLSLPLQAQETYRVLLMVPIGAFIMLLLRNLVGVKTYGTFMPVLIALAFRETALVAGVTLFVLVVGFGLLVRFYLERLRLLLVPRLTAILILVVLLMAAVSVLSNRLGLEVGLSVALFPMVIMAMTIERMSVAWDERGAGTAIREGVGTLVVAALAYLVMSWQPLEHLVFVYPEVLLVLFAFALLLGRYSGYRLNELFRFRALAREPDPIVPPPSPGDATETASSGKA
ncbi:MAG TPA: UUP1 family membrane protein [Arenimonas sp.]|uniref:UUP1 family membrane protein n=1 Tax=Arenimonas sp. TaxID=1872635 RepID=UPI002D7E27EE|nr:UUP1 family membrane protein [Arenimonas sp.]HEU0152185.1 UUP1 family membrane protein [Arenimonas sp.]